MIIPVLKGRSQLAGAGAQGGPVAVMPLTEALLLWIATPVSKPVMVPGPVTTTPVRLEAMMIPWLATAAGTWQLPAKPSGEPAHEIV